MLEIKRERKRKKTPTKMKHAFHRLPSRLDTAEKRVSELEAF